MILNNIFKFLPKWDTCLHTTSGFIFAFLGYKLVIFLTKKNKTVNLNSLLIYIFVIAFSMTLGLFWEFFEYGGDMLIKSDMQKDRIVRQISSVRLSPNDKKNVTIKDIDKTILQDKYGNTLITIDGYLDIGIMDTMKDLLVNLLGAVIYLLLLLLYKKRHNNI